MTRTRLRTKPWRRSAASAASLTLARGEGREDLVVRAGHLGGRRLDAGGARQVAHVADLLVGHQGDDRPGRSGFGSKDQPRPSVAP